MVARTLFAELLRNKYGKQFKNVLDPQFAGLIPGFLSSSVKLFRLQHLIVLNHNIALCLVVIRVLSGCFSFNKGNSEVHKPKVLVTFRKLFLRFDTSSGAQLLFRNIFSILQFPLFAVFTIQAISHMLELN